MSENTITETRRANRVVHPVAGGVHIYRGAHINLVDGFAEPAEDKDGECYGGVALEEANNSDGSDGDLKVGVLTGEQVLVTGSGFAQTDLGEDLFIKDSGTMALRADVTHAVYGGRFVEFVSATEAWMDPRLPQRKLKLGDLSNVVETGAAENKVLKVAADLTWAPAADAT